MNTATYEELIQYFMDNYKIYDSHKSKWMSPKTNMIDSVIVNANSNLAISIFKDRFKKQKFEVVKRDLFECLIIAVRSQTGVYIEIDGIRWDDKNCGKKRYKQESF